MTSSTTTNKNTDIDINTVSVPVQQSAPHSAAIAFNTATATTDPFSPTTAASPPSSPIEQPRTPVLPPKSLPFSSPSNTTQSISTHALPSPVSSVGRCSRAHPGRIDDNSDEVVEIVNNVSKSPTESVNGRSFVRFFYFPAVLILMQAQNLQEIKHLSIRIYVQTRVNPSHRQLSPVLCCCLDPPVRLPISTPLSLSTLTPLRPKHDSANHVISHKLPQSTLSSFLLLHKLPFTLLIPNPLQRPMNPPPTSTSTAFRPISPNRICGHSRHPLGK